MTFFNSILHFDILIPTLLLSHFFIFINHNIKLNFFYLLYFFIGLWTDKNSIEKNNRICEEWLDNDVYQPYLSEKNKMAAIESDSTKVKVIF